MNTQQLPVYPGWETVRVLGRGSFGAVYEIQRDLFGKIEKAALKLISIPQSESDLDELYNNGYDDASITAHFKDYLADIVREYTLMAEMKGHTNVVYCDDIRYVQKDDGFGWDIYIKMELLTPLMKALQGEASEDQVVKLGRDLCSALVLCKSRNIIHRDIKPQNIFVSKDGDYKLGDFGIAKTVEKTSGGTKIGTYNYMAPEVYNNQPYGHAADIYSLGLVLYWLLNERRMPFNPLPPAIPKNSDMEQARLRRFNGEAIPAPAHGSEALKRIVLKACAYDPKDRYQSADEMLRDLEALNAPAAAPASVGAATSRPPIPNEDGTVGAFGKPSPTPVGAATSRPPISDEDGTVGVFKKPAPAPAPIEPEPKKEEIKADEPEPEKPTPTPPAPPKKKTGLIVGIVGVLAVAAAVLLFVLLPKGNKPTAAEPSETPTQDLTAAPVAETSAETAIPWAEGDWDWSLESGVLTISGKGNTKQFSSAHDVPWHGQSSQIRTIVVRDGIAGLGDHAFSGCSQATRLFASGSVKEIGAGVFAECSSLREVFFAGNEQHWQALSVEEDNEALSHANVHFDSAVLAAYSDAASLAAALNELELFRESLKTASVGDMLSFGAYEQDNNTANGSEAIEWRVLAKEGNRILVISRYALDCRMYNDVQTNVTWETCSLRAWLNDEFINTAFNPLEQTLIPTVTVVAEDNPTFGTDAGNDTRDKLFLLSMSEAGQYFSSDAARRCVPTMYALAHGARYSQYWQATWWWLRTPGSSSDRAGGVRVDGSYEYQGTKEYFGEFVTGNEETGCDNTVRPAMWLDFGT